MEATDEMTEIMVDEVFKELKHASEITDTEKLTEKLTEIKEMISRHIRICIELDKAKNSLQG